MRSDQGEPVLMLVDLLHRDLPALHRMTLFAIGTELAFMDVSMAIRAPLADVGENRFGVALCASHAFVHAAKREPGLAVVEFRTVANRLPTAQRVTVLAG